MILSLFKKGNRFFQLFFDTRPKVYWWSFIDDQGIQKENFGDYLNPYLVEKLTGKKPVFFSPNSRFSFFFKHCIMIGSIISKSNSKTIVWGSGILKKNEKIKGGEFLAVRGPRTAKRLEELGFTAPKIYGDPALLLPLVYNKKQSKKFEIGIIPHYVNYKEIEKFKFDKEKILIINLLSDNVEDVLNQILSCKKIISTSLHGLILAHAYQIPAIWWQYTEIRSDDVKFYDYLESVQLNLKTDYKGLTFDEIIEIQNYDLPNEDVIRKMQDKLLSVFPYKINNKFN